VSAVVLKVQREVLTELFPQGQCQIWILCYFDKMAGIENRVWILMTHSGQPKSIMCRRCTSQCAEDLHSCEDGDASRAVPIRAELLVFDLAWYRRLNLFIIQTPDRMRTLQFRGGAIWQSRAIIRQAEAWKFPCAAHFERMRRVPSRGDSLGCPSWVSSMRACRLLRFFTGQARNQALHWNETSGYARCGAGGLGVVLCA